MKLSFKKTQFFKDIGPVVYPVTDTGEEIDDVVSCHVESGVDKLTVMTLTIEIRPEKNNASLETG